MSDDPDRIHEIQERLARLERESAAADAFPDQRPTDASDAANPVQPARRSGRRRGWLFILSLVLATGALAELALTVQGWSSPDFDDAHRTGTATVVSCERRGPVGRGIGYWDRCTADVVWAGGFSGRYTFARRNFVRADEVGTTFTIGENPAKRTGGVSFSRPEAPHRPLIVGLGVLLAVAAGIPALFLLAAAFFALRGGLRNLRHD